MLIKILGFSAAALTTIAYIPQAVKTWKTKSTRDISFWMFMLLFIGLILWLLYGILSNDLPIILANAFTLLFAGIILFYIIKPGNDICITHVAIWVNDLEVQKQFYCLNFNGKSGVLYKNISKNFSSYFISFNSGARLELMHSPDIKPTPTKNHIAISVGNKRKVDKLTQELAEKGVQIVSQPRTQCY